MEEDKQKSEKHSLQKHSAGSKQDINDKIEAILKSERCLNPSLNSTKIRYQCRKSPEQLNILEKSYYDCNGNVNKEEIEKLMALTDLDSTKISKWFYDRKLKDKKLWEEHGLSLIVTQAFGDESSSSSVEED